MEDVNETKTINKNNKPLVDEKLQLRLTAMAKPLRPLRVNGEAGPKGAKPEMALKAPASSERHEPKSCNTSDEGNDDTDDSNESNDSKANVSNDDNDSSDSEDEEWLPPVKQRPRIAKQKRRSDEEATECSRKRKSNDTNEDAEHEHP